MDVGDVNTRLVVPAGRLLEVLSGGFPRDPEEIPFRGHQGGRGASYTISPIIPTPVGEMKMLQGEAAP